MLGMMKIDACDMEKISTQGNSEKKIDILGDRWWRQKANQERAKVSKTCLCHIWKKRCERPNIEGVSIRSRNGLEKDAWSKVK